MCSASDNTALPVLGFPIRRSAGQRLFSASPRLIAAVHVLHRLLVPRHPPCALTILTVIFIGYTSYEGAPGDTRLHWLLCSFQGPRRVERNAGRPGPEGPLSRRRVPVSQNSTACNHTGASRCGRVQARSTCLEPSALRASVHAAHDGMSCAGAVSGTRALAMEGSLERR